MSTAPQPLSNPTTTPVVAAGLWSAPSSRWALLYLFWGGTKWLVLAVVLGFVTSVKLHAPQLLADAAWLSYGRLQAASAAVFLYGFAVPVALGMTFWLLTRLGRTVPAWPSVVLAGAAFWHLGVLIGVIGLLAGDGTGYRWFSLPGYAAAVMGIGYLMMGVCALATFRNRAVPELYPSQWFLLAAVFWFPWVFFTAYLLLDVSAVRGVLQVLVDGWYGAQLTSVVLGFVGLAGFFYWLPKLSGRPLYSQYHAMLAFWLLVAFSGWRGVSQSAPLPAWIPGLTTVFAVLGVVPLLAVVINLHRTLSGAYAQVRREPTLGWLVYAAAAYAVAVVAGILGSLPSVARVTDLTLFGPGVDGLFLFGFVGTMWLAVVRWIMPQVIPEVFGAGRLSRLALGCWGVGVLVHALPLLGGGVLQGLRMAQPELAFMEAFRPALMALRLSTLGDLLMLAGAAGYAWAFGTGLLAACRAWWTPRWAEAVRIQPAEARR